jgi:hypothetical protein
MAARAEEQQPRSDDGANASVETSAPPFELNDTQRSQLAISRAHLADAATVKPHAALFESKTALDADQVRTGNISIRYVFDLFTSPGDDVDYVEVDEWFGSGSPRHSVVRTLGFIQVFCVAYRPGCDPATRILTTGEPEPAERHAPLQAWNLDLDGIATIVQREAFPGSATNVNVTVTSVGRLSLDQQLVSAAPRLGQLPSEMAIIKVDDGSVTSESGPVTRYLILNAQNGDIIDSGSYSPALPPAMQEASPASQ